MGRSAETIKFSANLSRTMASCLELNIMETDLIMNHNELIKKLEQEYTNYICTLLKQKSMILDNLQRQFIEQRIRIKQTLSSRNSNNYKKENQISNPLPNGQSTESIQSLYAMPIKSEIPNNASPINEQTMAPLNSLEEQISYIASLENVQRRSKRLRDRGNNQKSQEFSKNTKKKRHTDRRKRVPTNSKKTSKRSASNNSKRHKCPHCEYSTNERGSLTRHIRTHTGEKPFVCSYGDCKKRFARKDDLNRHIRAHLGIKNHKCSYCSKAFVQKCHLTEHIRTHTGETPYECNHCKKKFKHSSSMDRHIKRKHK